MQNSQSLTNFAGCDLPFGAFLLLSDTHLHLLDIRQFVDFSNHRLYDLALGNLRAWCRTEVSTVVCACRLPLAPAIPFLADFTLRERYRRFVGLEETSQVICKVLMNGIELRNSTGKLLDYSSQPGRMAYPMPSTLAETSP